MNNIRFAILGCGRIAYRHIEAINKTAGAQLVALCDLDSSRTNSYAKEFGVSAFSNYHKMLNSADVDVVNIMTPSGMHAEHTIDIIKRYKKHIVVEKPMALRVEDCQTMIGVAKDNGVKLFVVHQNRFNLPVRKVREVISKGEFGKLSMATVRIRWSRDQAYYDRDPWRGTWAFDGGALTNQAVHHIDLLRWVAGDIVSVSAIADTRFITAEIEDTAVAWVKFANGAIGAIEATTTVRPSGNDIEASMSIIGERGVAIVEGAAVNKMAFWNLDSTDVAELTEDIPNVYGFGHDHVIANVVESLYNGAPPAIMGEDAQKSIELLNAIYCSIEQGGKEVLLSDEPRSHRLGVIKEGDNWIAELYRSQI
jgi:predicted dehydrogenase